jgi:hypothetical protein
MDSLTILNLASTAFALATVAFLAGTRRLDRLAGLGAGSLVVATSVRAFDALCGVLVSFSLVMAAASVLVFLLSPRADLRRPVAFLGAALGTTLLALANVPT